MIQFINDSKLARRLKEGTVSEGEKLAYYLIYSVLLCALTSSFFIDLAYTPGNIWDHSIDSFTIVLTFFGTFGVYLTNQRGDNTHFIERVTCLSFPIINQVLITLMLLIIPVFIIFDEVPEETSFFDFGFITLFMLGFYMRLNRAIRIASS